MTTDHKALLKELVDAPFGKAEEILKAKGYWDEKRAQDSREPGLKTYRINVIGRQWSDFEEIFTVEAESDEEAEELAMDKAENEYGDVEIDDTEIVSCK